jgi:hypothetical protein
MNVDQVLSTVRQIIKAIGLVIACVAVAKLLGVQIPIRAGIIELAAVAIACAHA